MAILPRIGPLVFRRWQSSYVTIAKTQKLYVIDKSTPGSVFFMPHGTKVFERLIEFMKLQQRAFGFEQVVTPLIYKNDLWKTSGHYQHYKDDMFGVSSGEHAEEEHDDFSLKPMNCPGHCVMFSKHNYSFRELPIRYADFSPLHRNEASGALTGLTRVRKFHQDDGHIFCRQSQIQQEIESCLKLLGSTYHKFQLNDYELVLSTRPEEFAGDVEVWDRAENGLRQALDASGRKWTVNEGDGAFYGPKIDVLVTDGNGKQHQLATIQLDFQLPKRFELQYQAENDLEEPVLIHRAIFGSLERFMALLIDHYDGKWPFWLSPRQAVIVPVAERHFEYANQVAQQLSGKTFDDSTAVLGSRSFNVELAASNETVGTRVQRANQLSANFVLMIGDKEIENGKIAVRERGSRSMKQLTVDEIRQMFEKLELEYK